MFAAAAAAAAAAAIGAISNKRIGADGARDSDASSCDSDASVVPSCGLLPSSALCHLPAQRVAVAMASVQLKKAPAIAR